MMKIKLFHILLVIISLSCYSTQKKIKNSVGVILIPKANCMVCKEQISNLLESDRGVKSFEIHLNERMILLTYDNNKTDINSIDQLIALNRHQTADTQPDLEALKNLPNCCK